MLKHRRAEIFRRLREKRISPWFYGVIAGLILAILITWISHWGIRVSQNWANLQNDPTDAAKRKFDASLEIAKAIVGGAGTVATIFGGIILYLNFRVANKNVKLANENIVIANKNIELSESRLITERFSKAVEQLGNDKVEVRLGAIYALERIAHDSDRDHWTIMEILASFIHERTLPKEIPMPKDVQAALTVIGRRDEKDPTGKLVDLRRAFLSGADLTSSTFKGINFSGADLSNANLQGVYLNQINLSDANLTSSNLNGAVLVNVNLSGANFSGANLRGAFLKQTNLSGSILSSANLSSTDLSKADLTSAALNSANLNAADLSGAILSSTDLSKADLSGANLSGIDLVNVHFIETILTGSCVTLEQLQVARLCRTRLPEGIALSPNRDCKELGISEN